MKKVLIALLAAFAVFALAGCPDATGLHNLPAAKIKVSVVNWPVNGSFAIPGSYQGTWANGSGVLDVASGAGTSSELIMTSDTVTFTITTKGEWGRPWFPATSGNSLDTFSGNMQNIKVEGLPLGGNGTILLDGGTSPMTITLTEE